MTRFLTILIFILISALLTDTATAQNLIQNPGFEYDFTNWGYGHYPPDSSGIETITSEGCYSGKCLMLSHGDSTWQGAYQNVGKLEPGKLYLFSTRFKTSSTHYGYINLHDPEWRNSSCDVTAQSNIKLMQGTDQWETINYYFRAPESDLCGMPVKDHSWYVYLYSYHPFSDSSPVYYDNISLSLVGESGPPVAYYNLEETGNWIKTCLNFSDDYPLVKCHSGFVLQSYSDKIAGQYSVVLNGTREKQEAYETDILVKPDTKYKISVSLKIANWTAYNYLNLDYPAIMTQQRDGVYDNVDGTLGIWSGLFFLKVDNVNFLPVRSIDWPYIPASDIDWFKEETYFTTGKNQATANMQIILQGFEGRLFIDNLTIQEVDSHIDDKYFHIPITYEFQGMRIKQLSLSPLSVETSAAKFVFSDSRIQMTKDGLSVSEITFSPGFLTGLSATQEQGTVLLENSNIMLSIGADSMMLAKLKSSSTVSVKGNRPPYSNFEAGIVFATDYSRGVLFSPLRMKQEILNMPYRWYEDNGSVYYTDADFEARGLKFWSVKSGFSDPSGWEVEYNFSKGDGFVTEIFPPKDFNFTKYCKERMYSLEISINTYPLADFSYDLQDANENINIGLLWAGGYDAPVNTMNPPKFYCMNSAGYYVHCDSPDATSTIPLFVVTDAVHGAYTVSQEASLKRLVEEAHKRGMKLIVYMSPYFHYTSDPDTLLASMRELLDEYNLDGVYFDTMLAGDTLKNIELVRKARNILKDRFFAQHESWTRSLIFLTYKFRLPYEDAYSDLMLTGENVKAGDSDIWPINYCGRNVSNTVSMLLAEFRPVNRSATDQENLMITLSPEEQIDRTLACNGIFEYGPYSDTSVIHDTILQISVPFEVSYFVDRYNTFCLPYTCGDDACDIGEDIYTCPQDCVPKSGYMLTNNGSTYTCCTENSVAQWLVNGEPLYDLRFTFDGYIASDDSQNKLSPYRLMGVTYENPWNAELDGRKAFYFNGSTRIFGEYRKKLDLTGKNFSAFAKVKKEDINPGSQIVFSLNSNGHFYYGIYNGKLFASIRDQTGLQKTFSGVSTIDSDWHTIGVVYNTEKLLLYLDGAKEAEAQTGLQSFPEDGIYSIGALSQADQAYTFRGYIDEMFLSTQALTEEQVVQYHLTGHKTISLSGEATCVIAGEPGDSIPLCEGSEADIDNNDCVNIFDLIIIAIDFGKTSGLTNPNCDINKDGVVDIFDLIVIGKYFGAGC